MVFILISSSQCTELELLKFLDIMLDISTRFTEGPQTTSGSFKSDTLREAFSSLSCMKERIIQYRAELNGPGIRKGETCEVFNPDEEKYPLIDEIKDVSLVQLSDAKCEARRTKSSNSV